MYPALPLLNRECNKDYPIPGTNHIIKKGTAVIISQMGIARDPEYFPDPDTFRPERFSDEVPAYNTDAYIPFGEGPRACIGNKKKTRFLNLLKTICKCIYRSPSW